MNGTRKIIRLPIEEIRRNPKQPRKRFNAETLTELARSIKQEGLIHPVIVETDGKGYMLVDGERRWRAAKMAGLPSIEAIVQDRSNHNGRERLLTGMIANIQREDMNPIDEAEAVLELHNEYGMSPTEIANKMGKSVAWVYIILKRMDLEPEVREMMRAGKLTHDPRVVGALLSIREKDGQILLARHAVAKDLKINSIILAASRVREAMAGGKISKGKTPALQLSRKRARLQGQDEEARPPRWTALLQIGRVPPWNLVTNAAQDTCAGCELREMANEQTCGRCPLVEILTKMMEATK